MVTITLKTIFNEEVGLIILSQALAPLEKKQTTPRGRDPRLKTTVLQNFNYWQYLLKNTKSWPSQCKITLYLGDI